MKMPFVNEKTYYRFLEEGKEEEFHKLFEIGLEKAKEELGKEYPILIGNEYIKTQSKFEVKSPIDTSIIIGIFQNGDEGILNKALKTAKEYFKFWQTVDWHERVELSTKAAEEIRRNKFELAGMITYENGKNRYESVAEVDETIDYFNYYAHVLEENRGFIKEMESRILKNERANSVLRPYGAWLILSPFNFPLAITTTMSLGALITGNTIVIKPSPHTPLSAYKLVEILRSVGFPKEAVNYVTVSNETIAKFLEKDSGFDGIAFTGSKEVGQKILKQAISIRPRPIVLELGGKNATIVTSKADLKKAVEGIYRGAFGFGAQKCSATSRVFVESKVYNEFINLLKEKVEKIVIGDPRKKETFLGPIINKGAVEKYKNFINRAINDGGKILIGGKVIEEKESYLVEPTIIVDLPYESELWRIEFFVPILLIKEVKNLEEAIKLSNDVDYGLTAGIFSNDEKEVEYFFNNIEAGVTYANREIGSTTGAMPGVQPFGGWKSSGFTGRNAGGPYYLISFLREQARTTYL
jgi:1-pyrroline-5-carboxylate dehydrogenase